MKKYLLSALLGVFGFVGAFASAENLSFISDSIYNYSPSSFTTDGGIASNFNFVCDDGDCYFKIHCPYVDDEYSDCFYYDDDYQSSCLIVYGPNYNPAQNECNGLDFSAGTYTVDNDSDVAFSSVSFTIGDSGGAGTEGTNPDVNMGGSLLPGGEGSLSGIIIGLNSTITEFIPYLVYLGLGIITVIIGFVAIRWLVNRTQAKIRGTFSSGRRRK